MAGATRSSKQASNPTLKAGQSDLDTRGAQEAANEVVVNLSYNGVNPLVVAAGPGILLPFAFAFINPPGLFSPGVNVPEVLLFNSSQGVQNVTLGISFDVQGSVGARAWFFQAELGFNLDSLTPSPPLGFFAATGGSTNQGTVVSMSRTFEAGVATSGLQVQLRLGHDGGVPVTIDADYMAVVTFGESSGRTGRLE